MNTALMPMPRQQFTDANAKPLSGGKLFFYQAGTSTPLTAYSDSIGTAATNPVVLDAGGFCSVWLGPSSYKVVAQNAAGVVQWTVDKVTAVSLAQVTGASTLSTLNVTGAAIIGGTLEVDGTLNGTSIVATGSASISGSASAGSLSVTGASTFSGPASFTDLGVTGTETVYGNLVVNGTAALPGGAGNVKVGGTNLDAYVTSLIPAISSLAGSLILSSITTSGAWCVLTFGATAGTRVKIAIGHGTAANGATVTLPSGFAYAQSLFTAALASADGASHPVHVTSCTISSAGVVACTQNDASGNTWTGTASWSGIAWATGA